MHPKIKHIVAIATESGDNSARSEDFGYMDVSEWDDEKEREATQLQQELQILVKAEPMHVHSSEYPDVVDQKHHPRNSPCPCGSRKKYKKCCINKKIYNW